MIIAVDVDGVVANTMQQVLNRYNSDCDDFLTIQDITDWDIGKFAKSEFRQRIFQYFSVPNLYYDVLPIEGAYETLMQWGEMGHRIVYVTTPAQGTDGVKRWWLKEHGFLFKKDYSRDYVECVDKTLIAANMLIDDKFENARSFPQIGVLFNQPWNSLQTYGWRAENWEDMRRKFVDFKYLDSIGVRRYG